MKFLWIRIGFERSATKFFYGFKSSNEISSLVIDDTSTPLSRSVKRRSVNATNWGSSSVCASNDQMSDSSYENVIPGKSYLKAG